jgi:hypothetical protein
MQCITVELANIDTTSVNVNSDIKHDRKSQIVGTYFTVFKRVALKALQ